MCRWIICGRTSHRNGTRAAQAKFAFESGYKMGQQQIIGAVLLEFSLAMSNEIMNCFRDGIAEANEHVLAALARRARRVGEQVLDK